MTPDNRSETQPPAQAEWWRQPKVGRFLFNLAVIAIIYFIFSGGHWNFLFVLFAAAAVTWSKGLYESLEQSIPWLYWALLGFGGLIVLLGLYRAFAGGG